MIVEKCSYNEETDNTAVEQYGFINLAEVIANGAIPSSVSNTEMEYNDIEDPASILGKPHDVFEAYRMMDHIKTAGKVKDKNTATVEQS